MKKILMISAALLMFSSCAWKEGDGRNPDESDPMVMSVDVKEKAEASKLFESVEEIKGKKIGEHIIMPNEIETPDYNDVYTFKLEDNYSTEDCYNKGVETFKKLFGDSFREDLVLDYNTLSKPQPDVITYNDKHPLDTGNHYDENVSSYARFCGYINTILFDRKKFTGSQKELRGVYYPSRDKNVKMELEGGECTVGEACETVEKLFKEYLHEFEKEGLIPDLKNLYYYTDSGGKSGGLVSINCGVKVDGISVQSYFTSYNYLNTTADGKEETYYSPVMFEFSLDGKDSILFFRGGLGPQKIISTKKQNEVISLKQAAEILDRNVAENLVFTIGEIRLEYCRKVTSYTKFMTDPNKPDQLIPQDFHSVFSEFRPVWSFELAGNSTGIESSQSLKVDALTGEITIDVSEENLNRMYIEQDIKRPNK